MRKRNHSEKHIHALRELLKQTAKERFIDPTPRPDRRVSVHVIRGVDLRATLEEKAIDCNHYADWTAFVNRTGTLVHVLPKEGDFHVRIPLYFSTANCTDYYVERLIQTTINGRLR